MSKPYIHSLESVKYHQGRVEDYLPIHNFLDSSKGAFPTNIHRALTHTSWFIMTVLERVKFPNSIENPDGTFSTIKNSDGKIVSIRDLAEEHVLSDFKGRFIPTAQDYLQEIEFKKWMQNGDGYPPSAQKLEPKKKTVPPIFDKPEDKVYDGTRFLTPPYHYDTKIID